MKCEELRVDLRKTTQEERAEGQRCAQLLFQLNHTNSAPRNMTASFTSCWATTWARTATSPRR